MAEVIQINDRKGSIEVRPAGYKGKDHIVVAVGIGMDAVCFEATQQSGTLMLRLSGNDFIRIGYLADAASVIDRNASTVRIVVEGMMGLHEVKDEEDTEWEDEE